MTENKWHYLEHCCCLNKFVYLFSILPFKVNRLNWVIYFECVAFRRLHSMCYIVTGIVRRRWERNSKVITSCLLGLTRGMAAEALKILDCNCKSAGECPKSAEGNSISECSKRRNIWREEHSKRTFKTPFKTPFQLEPRGSDSLTGDVPGRRHSWRVFAEAIDSCITTERHKTLE